MIAELFLYWLGIGLLMGLVLVTAGKFSRANQFKNASAWDIILLSTIFGFTSIFIFWEWWKE